MIILIVFLFIFACSAKAQHILQVFADTSQTSVGEIRLWDLDASAYEGWKADPTITTTVMYELPGEFPGSIQCMTMDVNGKVAFTPCVGGSNLWTDNTTNISPLGGITTAVAVGTVTELAKHTVVGDLTGEITSIIRGVASQTADIFQVQQSDGTSSFTVEANGEIGIGTSNPTNLLDIVYTDGNYFVSSTFHQFRMTRRTIDSLPPTFSFEKNRNFGPALANDQMFDFLGIAADSLSNPDTFIRLNGVVVDPTAGSEDGRLDFYVMSGGVLSNQIQIRSNDILYLVSHLPFPDSTINSGSTSFRWSTVYGDLVNSERFELENAAHTGHFVFKFQDLNTELQILDTVGNEMMTFVASTNRIEIYETLFSPTAQNLGLPGSAFGTLYVNSVGSSSFFPAVFANALDVNSITNSVDISLNQDIIAGTPNVTLIGTAGSRFDGNFDNIDMNSCSGAGCTAGTFYQTLRDAGVAETQRAVLNFVSMSMVLTDDAVGGETEFTLLSSPVDAPALVGTARLISTTSPITGGGDLSLNRTFACATCAVTGIDNNFSVEQTVPSLNANFLEIRGTGTDYFIEQSSTDGLRFGALPLNEILEIEETSTVLNDVRFLTGTGASDDIRIRLLTDTEGNGWNFFYDRSADKLFFENHSGGNFFTLDDAVTPEVLFEVNLIVSSGDQIWNQGIETIRSDGGFQDGVSVGIDLTCSGGNVVQNVQVSGGLIVAGTCTAN